MNARWLRVGHPMGFAAAAMLSVAVSNPGDYSIPDLLVVLAAVTALTWLVFVAAYIIQGPGRSAGAAAVVATLVVGWAFYCVPALPTAERPGLVRVVAVSSAMLAAWVASVALSVRALRRHLPMNRVNAVLSVAAVLLLVRFGAELLWDQLTQRASIASSQQAELAAQPVPLGPPVRSSDRDIYLIILDAYSDRETLKRYYGLDNTQFEDRLRALGFSVPQRVRASYPQTVLSLASMLNMSDLDALAADVTQNSRDQSLLYHLIEHSRVARFLQSQGYRYIFIPSPWWIGTHESAAADEVLRQQLSIAAAIGATDFRRDVFARTPLRWIEELRPGGDSKHVSWSFRQLVDVAGRREKTFTLLHVLSPHPPYVLDARCRSRRGGTTLRSGLNLQYGHRAEYADQVQCLNALLLATVDSILERSSTPPIILLQGDHGTAFQQQFTKGQVSALLPEEIRERAAVFGAYYLPEGGDSAFGASVTTVNVLRNVLRYYFSARLPPLREQIYWAWYGSPYMHFPVQSP